MESRSRRPARLPARSWLVPVSLAALLAGCGGAPAPEAGKEDDGAAAALEARLAEIRAATERFADVAVAEREGYVNPPGNMCVEAPMLGRPASEGAMGLHYVHPALLGLKPPGPGRVAGTDAALDWSRPEALMYEPQPDGSLRLVGVEYLVFREGWAAAGQSGPPTFEGTPFDYMEDDPATALDEAHGFEPHYDLHIWLYRENSAGLFAQFNPNVTCAHAQAHATPS